MHWGADLHAMNFNLIANLNSRPVALSRMKQDIKYVPAVTESAELRVSTAGRHPWSASSMHKLPLSPHVRLSLHECVCVK